MKVLIEIFITLLGAYLFAMVVPNRMRDRMTPYAIAFLFWWETSGALFCTSLKLYYLLKLFSWGCMAFVFDLRLLHSLRRRNVLVLFTLFWTYWTFAHFLGNYPVDALVVNFRCLRMILIGILTGAWAMRCPNGFESLFRVITFAALLVGIQYVSHSNWNAKEFEEAGGRQVVDTYMLTHEEASKYNVNGISTACSSIVAYPFLYAMGIWRTKREKIIKIVAFLALLILVLVLIKTGSRNGGLAFFAMMWYVLFAKTNLRQGAKIIISASVVLFVTIGVVHFMGNAELRIFKLVNVDELSFAEMGTGRGGIFLLWFEQMDDLHRIIGMGTPWYELEPGMRVIYNCHSIYFQIIITAGYIGCVLFALFVIFFFVDVRKAAKYSSVAVILFLIWVFTGAGESANLVSSSSGLAKYGLGFALALCSGSRFLMHQEFDDTFGFGCNRQLEY